MAEVDSRTLFERGNEAAAAKRLEEASECYTKAIEKDSANPTFFLERSSVHLELQKYDEVKKDVCKVLDLRCSDDIKAQASFRKGVACFHLQEYKEALETFTQCQKCNELQPECDSWIEKCNRKLQAKDNVAVPSSQSSSVDKIRYDWYQTETQVVINILLKKLAESDVKVDFQENTLNFTAKLSNSSDYSLELDLAHKIVPNRSVFKVTSSKVEIKMQKEEGIRWRNLQRDNEEAVKQFIPDSASDCSTVTKYPSSRQEKIDWDKLVVDLKKEEAEEKMEGEDALNQLFQKIYSDGTDEVKKAMNKSFMESGGTVLSTNWKQVGNKKVDVKPPEGMEWKKWN